MATPDYNHLWCSRRSTFNMNHITQYGLLGFVYTGVSVSVHTGSAVCVRARVDSSRMDFVLQIWSPCAISWRKTSAKLKY